NVPSSLTVDPNSASGVALTGVTINDDSSEVSASITATFVGQNGVQLSSGLSFLSTMTLTGTPAQLAGTLTVARVRCMGCSGTNKLIDVEVDDHGEHEVPPQTTCCHTTRQIPVTLSNP